MLVLGIFNYCEMKFFEVISLILLNKYLYFPLYKPAPLFAGTQLSKMQKKNIKKMYKPAAPKKNLFNDIKIFFEEVPLSIEELDKEVEEKKSGKF